MRNLLALCCVAGCWGGRSKNATSKGAVIIEWSARDASEATTFENRATNDNVITVNACGPEIPDDDIKLVLHVTRALPSPGNVGAIAKLTAIVEDSRGFELTNGACDGPDNQLDCHFTATKPRYECLAHFKLRSDGSVAD